MWLLRPLYGLSVRFQYSNSIAAWVIGDDRVLPRDQRHLKAPPLQEEAGAVGRVDVAHG